MRTRRLCTSTVPVALAAVVAALSGSAASAGPITPGNIVMYRAGDGSRTMDDLGNAVFVDEYTPAGVLVQSIPMPLSGSGVKLVCNGHEDQPLPELGNPVAQGLDDLLLDAVPDGLQFVDHRAQDEHLAVQGHVGDVLHHHGGRPGELRDLEEGAPEVASFVVCH